MRQLPAAVAGFVLGALAVWGAVAVADGEAWSKLGRGRAPPVPQLADRVVDVDNYDGAQEAMWDSLSFVFTKLLRTRYATFDQEILARHRSLDLETGLIDPFVSDARAKGWEVVEPISVDGVALYHAIGVEKDGYFVYLVALTDAWTPTGDNPGASREVLAQRHACSRAATGPRAPGNFPACDLAGFVPVWIYSDVPGARTHPWLSPDAPDLPTGDWPWRAGTTWSVVQAKAAR